MRERMACTPAWVCVNMSARRPKAAILAMISVLPCPAGATIAALLKAIRLGALVIQPSLGGCKRHRQWGGRSLGRDLPYEWSKATSKALVLEPRFLVLLLLAFGCGDLRNSHTEFFAVPDREEPPGVKAKADALHIEVVDLGGEVV